MQMPLYTQSSMRVARKSKLRPKQHNVPLLPFGKSNQWKQQRRLAGDNLHGPQDISELMGSENDQTPFFSYYSSMLRGWTGKAFQNGTCFRVWATSPRNAPTSMALGCPDWGWVRVRKWLKGGGGKSTISQLFYDL